MKRAQNETCRAILDFEGHERLDEGRSKTTTTTTYAERNKRIAFYHTMRSYTTFSPLVKSRGMYRTARERESERERERERETGR